MPTSVVVKLTEAEANLILDLVDSQKRDESYWGNREQFYKRLYSIEDKITNKKNHSDHKRGKK